MSPTPGLLFVNSKITSDLLTPDTFTRWYEDVHIPDIFESKGIKSAFRYRSPTPDAVERPFLALYPVADLAWLESAEFKAIPVHSDMLPNESKAIFDLADFDTRYYQTVGVKAEAGTPAGPAKSVVSVQFDSAKDDAASLFAASTPKGTKPVRSRVLKLHFQRRNRLSTEESKLDQPYPYLAIYEYDELPAKPEPSTKDATVKSFNLLKAFGDVNAEF